MLMQSEDGIGVGGDIGGCPEKDQAKDGCLNPSLSSTKSAELIIRCIQRTNPRQTELFQLLNLGSCEEKLINKIAVSSFLVITRI